MKILITGANSYIGTSFENYMKSFSDCETDTIDMIDGSWRKKDFSGYDTVFHVAGIAHSDTGNADEQTKAMYYKVNTDLAVETAQKAKNDGVKQFVFMSSIIVFGSNNTCITKDTTPNPDNFYGDSKLQADIQLHRLQSDSFNVVSVRPPMIYGKGSKGNYPRLAALAKKTPIFPDFENKRSMLYIKNLCECLHLIIKNNEHGFFYPQNRDYVKTAELVKCIADCSGKKIRFTPLFNPVINIFAKKMSTFKKVFGDLYYDKSMSCYNEFSYCITDFDESVRETEL